MSDTRTQALADVSAERDRQEARWGEQNHPTVAPHLRDDADGTVSSRVSRCYEVPMSSSARAALEYHVAHDTVTYGDILIEEVAEALEAAAEHGEKCVYRLTAAGVSWWQKRCDAGVAHPKVMP